MKSLLVGVGAGREPVICHSLGIEHVSEQFGKGAPRLPRTYTASAHTDHEHASVIMDDERAPNGSGWITDCPMADVGIWPFCYFERCECARG
jgi:hypothetical protein